MLPSDMTVPDSLVALAFDVGSKRRDLTKRYDGLRALNVELRAAGGVAFSEPNAEGLCVSYRANPAGSTMARGLCATTDRQKTMPPGVAQAPPALTKRLEEGYRAWQEAAGAAENARLMFEASGQSFLEDLVALASRGKETEGGK